MTIGHLLGEAGWLMAPIYACSFALVTLVVHKILELGATRRADKSWLDTTLSSVSRGRIQDAVRTCKQERHPAAKAAYEFLVTLPRRPDRAEAEANRRGAKELQRLERGLGLISFIAQAAPLLGLLGTVVGMVELFMNIQSSGGTDIDTGLLSSGIWKALLTTAAGLVVAVPALGAYAWLSGNVDRLRLQILDSISALLSALPKDMAPVMSAAASPCAQSAPSPLEMPGTDEEETSGAT